MVPKQEKDPPELKEDSVPVQYLSRMLPGPSAQGWLPKTPIAKEVRAELVMDPLKLAIFSVNESSYFDINGQTCHRQSSSEVFCISLLQFWSAPERMKDCAVIPSE